MAGPGTGKQVVGAQDTFGGHTFGVIDYSGVAAYVNGVGERLSPNAFGFFNNILTMIGESISITGDYFVVCQPSGIQNCQWNARWFVTATGAEVANGVNLSAKTVKLAAIGF